MKQEKLIQGIDYYINKDGKLVFTEKYHLEKGSCCGMGCLHCPYDYINVPKIPKPLLGGLEETTE